MRRRLRTLLPAFAIPRWFGLLPKADVRLEPQPAFREPTSDQYNGPSEDGSRPGVYLYSTWEPTKKSRSGPVSTAFHETIPGHHLQVAIALERAQAYGSRRSTARSSSISGWRSRSASIRAAPQARR